MCISAWDPTDANDGILQCQPKQRNNGSLREIDPIPCIDRLVHEEVTLSRGID